MNCDLMVGADVGVVNATSKEVYGQLYPQYFTGSQPFDLEGVSFTVSWDVKEAPVFDLTPPSFAEETLRAHLTAERAVGQATGSELTEHVAALRDSLDGSTFRVRLNQVHIKIDSGDGNLAEEDVAVTVDVQATTSGTGLFSLNPLRATADAPSKVDKIFLDKVVLPNVLDQSRKVLSGITLPAPQIPGLSLSTPVPVIQPQRAVAALNLAEHGTPQPPFPDSWPQKPFFALLGRDAVERIAQVATAYLEGKPFHAGDSKDFAGSSAYYKADVSMHNVRCEVVWDDVPTVRVRTAVSGSGSAGINWIWGGSTDAFFDLSLEPDPTVTLSLAMSGTTLKATAVDVSSFDLKLVPTRGDIVSLIVSWVVDALSSTFGGIVRSALRGVKFPVGDFPAIPVDVDPVHLDVTPTDLTLARFGDALALQGDVTVTKR
ncbi:hypothetical protein FGW37_01535 [Streptomyces rectiverticillatus]|uniref:hypothetical protein n=1 Tax=Streptomyces rectiverticillatus TaxID=173860 RepID=UPI0015C3F633|nr:hypothetical protein [Streptomyces rectiverticillatus]QLE70464.1 hypothetical protein FGW37_01535 [Streptomyces rectiverticillatus]